MYLNRKYSLRRRTVETGAGAVPETPNSIRDAARTQETQLDARRLSENLYVLQGRLEDEKNLLGISATIEHTGNVGSGNTNFIIGTILATGNKDAIRKLQEIINQGVIDGAKIPEDGLRGDLTINALRNYYGVIPTVAVATPSINTEANVNYDSPRIIGGNFSEIATEDEAMELAEKIIPKFHEAKNPREQKEAIVNYQKSHSLSVDGLIGKTTYLEMWAGDLSQRANNKIDELGIAPQTLSEIQEFFEKNPKMLGGTMVAALRGTLDNFKRNHSADANFQEKYGEFYTWYDKQETDFQASPEGQAQMQAAANATGEDGRSIYQMLKDGDWEQVATNPTLLLFAGLGFIFGMFGADTELTNAWWKRILVLGFGIANADSIKDIITDVKGGLSSPETRDAYNAARTTVTDGFKAAHTSITGIDTETLGKSFDSFVDSMKNIGISLATTHPERVVVDEKRTILDTHVLEKLSALTQEQLRNISNYGSLNGILDASAQTALRNAGITDTDINNYIQYYYIPSLGSFATFWQYMKDSLRTVGGVAVETLGGKFSENTVINSIIQRDLALFVQSPNEAEAKAGNDLVNALLNVGVPGTTLRLSARFDQFNIDDYSLSAEKKAQLLGVIEKIRFISRGEGHILEQVGKIEAIVVNSNPNDVRHDIDDTIRTKIKDLYDIKLDDTLLTGQSMTPSMFSREVFDTAFERKKVELFETALLLGVKSIAIAGVGAINIERELGGLRANEALRVQQSQTQELFGNVTEVPNTSATPLEFKNYYSAHKAAFEKAQEISTQYPDTLPTGGEKTLGDRAREVLALKTRFKTNYEIVKTRYVTKINDYAVQIQAVSIDSVDEQNFLEKRRALELIAQEHIKLRAQVIEGYTIGDISTLWNRYMGEPFLAEPSKNSFEFLDIELGIVSTGDEKPNLEITQGLVLDRAARLEGAFTTEIDTTSVDVNNEATVQAFMQSVHKKWDIVSTFETGQKERKTQELKNQVDKIVQVYVKKIQSVETISDAEIVYSSYVRNVENIVKGYLGSSIGGLIENTSAVNNVRETKIKEVQRNDFLKTSITEAKIETLLTNSGVIGFFRTHITHADIARIENGLGATSTLADIIFNLNLILEYPSVNQEIKTELSRVISKLDDEINIELNGYYDTYQAKAIDLMKSL